MGEPTEPTPAERAARLALGRSIVDATREDELSPSTKLINEFIGYDRRAVLIAEQYLTHTLRGYGRDVIKEQEIKTHQEAADHQRLELELMLFGLAQEVEMLDIEKKALKAELDAMHHTYLQED